MQKPKKQSARYCAAAILFQLAKERCSVKPIFDRTIEQHKLPANERNLTMQLVYGVLRQRQYLERMIALLSRTPLRKIDPFIRQALLVGLYQIFFLDRIPPSAAVNEAVESVKAAKIHKRLHGFVNGILRQAIRTEDELKEKARYDAEGNVILNHPEWLIKRWQTHFGKNATETFCLSNNSEPTLVLRLNTGRTDRESYLQMLENGSIEAQKGNYAPEAVVLPGFTGSPVTLPGFAKGYFQIQDEAAQLATSLLGPLRKGGNYLDGCAGLGGKTSHLLEKGAGLGCLVHAVDPEPFRLHKLKENIARLFDTPPLTVHQSSLLELGTAHLPDFDGILIDAPCSGTGVTGRHPDIRWNRQENDLGHYSDQQYALLNHAASLLKKDGVLVYATCSLEPEENSEVLSRFLESNPDFEPVDCAPFLPKEASGLIQNGFFHPLPSDTIDGFFAARLQRKE